MKNLFLLDMKELDDDLKLQHPDDPVYRLLKRYEMGLGDYENNKFTEAIFIRLGWSNQFKDTICSFRTIFYKMVEIYSENNVISLEDNSRIKFSFHNNKLKYSIAGKDYPYSYNKGQLYTKCTNSEHSLYQVLQLINANVSIWDNLNHFARLVDSLSNFTPHPGYPFNQAKGCLTHVADNFNLMVDKIQTCIEENQDLHYGEKNYEVVKLEKLKKWKEWLIENQSSYCLNDFYSTTCENKIVGAKFFANQSLSKPLPQTENEISEYLNNIKTVLERRAEMMDKSFR